MEDIYSFQTNYNSVSDYSIPPQTPNLIPPPSTYIDLDNHYRTFYSTDNLLSDAVSITVTQQQQQQQQRRSNRQRDPIKIDNVITDRDDDMIKSKIANHPMYPKLLDAFIDCQQVREIMKLITLF